MARSTPLLAETLLHLPDTVNPILVESPDWWQWLSKATGFRFTSTVGTFTAHQEHVGSAAAYWYGYRRHAGRLHKRYLGKSSALTITHLQTVAASLADPLPAPRRRAKATPLPEAVATHDYSAAWYWEHEDPQTAIGMAIAARSWEQVAPWLVAYSETLFKAGDIVLLQQWYQALPEAIIWRSPHLAFYATGLLLMTHHLPQADIQFAQLVQLLEQHPGHHLDAEILTMRALAASLHDADDEALRLAEEAEQRLPADAGMLRSALAIGLLVLYWRHGDFGRLRYAADMVYQTGAASGHLQAVIVSHYTHGFLALASGEPERALGRFAEALAVAPVATEHLVVGLAYLGKALVFWEWQMLEPAYQAWNQAVTLLRLLGDHDLLRQAGEVGLRLALARSDWEEGERLLAEMAEWCVFPYHAIHEVLVAEWSLARGDLPQARVWQQGITIVGATENYALWLTQVRAAALVLLACHDHQACQQLCLSALPQVAEGHLAWRSELLWFLAQAQAAMGHHEAAEATLQQLLPWLLSSRCRRLFAEAGPRGALILHGYLTRQGSTLATGEQQRLRDLYHMPPAGSTTLPRWLRLTAREQALLPLLNQGRTNAEIARHWGVSVGTVKTHLHHLYAKLLVPNRVGALHQARLLGLLSS